MNALIERLEALRDWLAERCDEQSQPEYVKEYADRIATVEAAIAIAALSDVPVKGDSSASATEPSLSGYPNLEAIYMGTIAGNFREWPRVRVELRRFVDSLKALPEAVSATEQPQGFRPQAGTVRYKYESPAPEERAIPEEVARQQESLMHPVTQVFFRAGLLACREYMARFVEAQDAGIAASIRANWWPSLGEDFGPPRLNDWGELTEGEYGEDGFRTKTKDEVSPTQEALPIALQFLETTSPCMNSAPVPEERRIRGQTLEQWAERCEITEQNYKELLERTK